MAWRLSSYDSGTLTSSIPLGTNGEHGQAASINDAATPSVVGYYFVGSDIKAFLSFLTATPELTPLGTPTPGEPPSFPFDPQGAATHVVNAEGSDDEFIVGYSLATITGGCGTGDDAMRWTETTPLSIERLVEDSSSSTPYDFWRAQANAANPQHQVAGFRVKTETYGGLAACYTRGAFWDEAGDAEEVGLLSPLGPDDQTVVLRMSSADEYGNGVLLLGKDLADQGIAWWRDPATSEFVVIRPSDLTITSTLDIHEFRDVNAESWMLGFGSFTHDPYEGSFLLVPTVCITDCNQDDFTDAADLGILLGNWGGCSNLTCLGDCDVDGDVDAADLGILLGAWGQCPDPIESRCTETPCHTENAALPQASTAWMAEEDESLNSAIAQLGFASKADLLVWLEAASPSQAVGVGESLLALLQQEGSGQ